MTPFLHILCFVFFPIPLSFPWRPRITEEISHFAGLCHVAARQIASHSKVREIFRRHLKYSAVVSTVCTEKGRREIDWFHKYTVSVESHVSKDETRSEKFVEIWDAIPHVLLPVECQANKPKAVHQICRQRPFLGDDWRREGGFCDLED